MPRLRRLPPYRVRRPLKGFYPAEAYHQDYLARHPDNPYIVINDLPKLDLLRETFPQLYKP